MSETRRGAQRLTVERLKKFEALEYGMFIHFGMSTFVQNELPSGNDPSTTYAPTNLDVDQWVSVARDAGMKYAVLTSKHVAGHCLWPSAFTDYDVETSSNKTDVVGKFVEACQKRGLMAGLYYCSWDNHHKFGSKTPSDVAWGHATTTQQYRDFQHAQINELLTHYAPIGEMWVDIPGPLEADGRQKQYDQIAQLNPDGIIMLNTGIGDGSDVKVDYAWPSDIIAIERFLPSSNRGYKQWKHVNGKDYYCPGEVCDPIGYEWFHVDGDHPRSDLELLGMRLIAKERHVNLLLDVPPDRTGQIPKERVDALMRLRKNYEKVTG